MSVEELKKKIDSYKESRRNVMLVGLVCLPIGILAYYFNWPYPYAMMYLGVSLPLIGPLYYTIRIIITERQIKTLS